MFYQYAHINSLPDRELVLISMYLSEDKLPIEDGIEPEKYRSMTSTKMSTTPKNTVIPVNLLEDMLRKVNRVSFPIADGSEPAHQCVEDLNLSSHHAYS